MFVLVKLLIIKHLVSVCELQCVVRACVWKVDGREEVCIIVLTWSGSSTRGFHGSSFSNPFPSVYCMNSCRDTSPSLSLSTWGERGKEGGRGKGKERGKEERREGFIVSLYPSPHTYFILTPTSVRTCSLMRAISSWASIPCMSSPYAFLTCERDIPRLIHNRNSFL